MRTLTVKEARVVAEQALAAAAIERPRNLSYPLDTMDALQLQALALWVGEAWNNGYVRGSDDATLKAVYTGVLPTVDPAPPTQRD